MGTPSNDRIVASLYAALTPAERSRLIARSWREGPEGEIARIRENIPDAVAGAAFNRTMRIMRALHGAPPGMVLATKLGIDKWALLLAGTYERAAVRRNLLAYLARVWRLLAYPVTAGEYRHLVDLERSEPEPVAEHLGFLCFDADLDRHPLRPELAAIARERRGEMTEAEAEAQWRRFLGCFRAAVRRGDLPKPTRRGGGACLPRGVLCDWAEGTTAATYEPFGPDFLVPELELFGGGLGEWDVRPDAEAAAVTARRAAMCGAFAAIVRDGGGVDGAITATLTLEPPATLAERDRRHKRLEAVWPWGMYDAVREDLRIIAAALASFRAELDAYEEVIGRLQAEEFGGEDPLDPRLREVLEQARESSRAVEATWAAVTEALAPISRDVTGWPPAIDNEAYRAELLPQIEAGLYGAWDD